ncbi:MAG: hypothetical protein IJX74_06290 [Clostridia bacterium]|nr:hypothetical protein [Clostridia bacterium]
MHVKMKKNVCTRLICLCLTLSVFAGCLAACNGNNADVESTTAESTSQNPDIVSDTLDEAEAALNAISSDDVDWGGKELTFLYSVYNTDNPTELISEEKTGDVLPDAVCERNVKFEDRCNLTLSFSPTDSEDDAFAKAQREVQGSVGDAQYFTLDHKTTAALAVEGYLYNFLDLNIDLEKDWWDEGTYSFNMEDHVFFMNGSWNYSDDRLTWCMLFNKSAYALQAYQGEDADLYQLVLDGKWTVDKFNNLIQNFSSNNGDGRWDEEDSYGFVATPHYSNAFFFGADLRYVNMHEDGYPTLALSDDSGMMERAAEMVEKVVSIYTANHATYRAAEFQVSYEMFKANQALFYGEIVSFVINCNKAYEGQFGVLPVPKYDEAQEKYCTYVTPFACTLSLPVNVQGTDKLGDITQTYAILSDQLVFPVFYEVVLTTKSVKDEQSVKMLDLILGNRVYDISNYFENLGMAGLFERSAENGNNNFSRDYASVKRGFSKQVRKLFDKLD